MFLPATSRHKSIASMRAPKHHRGWRAVLTVPVVLFFGATASMELEHVQEHYDEEEEYGSEEGEYEEYEEGEEEEHDGQIEDAEIDSAGEEEEIEDGGDDEDGDAPGPPGQPQQQQQQMLFIPGLGYFPLSQLGNIPGLSHLAARQQQQQAPPQLEGVKEWAALAQFPEETKSSLYELLNQLKEAEREELTVLLLGKGGVGKSSTVNSLLNERAATPMAFQQDGQKATCFSRRAAGFTLNLIDTPSLLEQDNVSEKRLEDIGKALEGKIVDAVLYLDRLDSYKLGPLDKRVLAGISRVLGPSIWNNTIVCFTRASESAAPPGVAFEDWVDERAQQLRGAIAAVGGKDADLPVALIENSSRCAVNEVGEKIVPSGEAWIPELMRQVKDVALQLDGYEYDPQEAARASNPDRRRKWLIPLVLIAQVAIKLLLDRVMDEDDCTGDANGPYDEQTRKALREQKRRDKEEAKKRAERKKARGSSSRYYDESDEDEDDY